MSITSKRQYIEVKEVGRGAFGRCTLARTIVGNKTYAIKEIKLEHLNLVKKRPGSDPADADEEEIGEMLQMLRDQGPLLANLRHVNIVKGFGSFEEDDAFYVVTEYCDGGDLGKAILERKAKSDPPNYYSEARILNWTIQLALALNYLHDKYILHRDIKPNNVFLQNNGRIVKLGSFGIARKLSGPDGFLMGQRGTMTHMPPEMCEGRAVTLKADVWSFGVTLYELASFSLPFDNTCPLVLCRDICRKTPKQLPLNGYSEGFRLLIETEMLNKEASNRPTIRQILGDSRILNAIAEMAISTNWGVT